MIRDDKAAAEWAVRKALDQIQAVFDRIEDPYFRERKSDVALVGERLLRNLVGVGDSASPEEAPKGSIAVAHELSPADAAQLGRAEAAGFCTEGGRPHVAHRDRGARAGAALRRRRRGTRPPGLVGDDGGHRRRPRRGDPGSRRGRAAPLRGARRACTARARSGSRRSATSPRQTLDGTPIHLQANIEMLEEIPIAVELGAEAVGLFRTEFLYLERADLPTEDEQYAHAVAALEERRRAAPSPSARWTSAATSCRRRCASRAARTRRWGCARSATRCKREDVFRTQLRALYRAAPSGRCRSCSR